MTKFEELTDIISKKKNKAANYSKVRTSDDDNNEELEVAGSESSKTPLLSYANDETDPDLLDQLHRSIKTKPNDGSGAFSWDSDY